MVTIAEDMKLMAIQKSLIASPLVGSEEVEPNVRVVMGWGLQDQLVAETPQRPEQLL